MYCASLKVTKAMAQLIISLHKQVVKKLPLTEASYVIGRSSDCDIVLNERTVSAKHAHLVNTGNECFLEDLQSTNGIYVNCTLTHKHLLLNKDLIQIGKYELLFENPFNSYQQIHALCSNAQHDEDSLEYARLEILNGEKIGQFISLKNKKINLSAPDSELGFMRLEENTQGNYLLYSLGKDKSLSSRILQANDKFNLGELELKFHQAIKLAKL